MMRSLLIPTVLSCMLFFSCKEKKKDTAAASTSSSVELEFPEKQLKEAEEQYDLLLEHAEKEDRIPRTVNEEGEMHWVNDGFDWTKGFFPGSCWYLFEHTKDEKWKKGAEHFQAKFEDFKNSTRFHDLGFVFYCSYGNGYEMTEKEAYKDILITAANSLIERFNPKVGAIKSWDVDHGWQSERGWEFPVIIDNMMNLELLFEASKLTGDDKYKKVAIAHANTTMKNHFRDDYSSYHVVDYDPETGEVRSKQTAQGYADESSWARGQAWGVYGYTMCYRYTKDEEYLKEAKNIADYILNYKGMPKDMVPYWDYDAPDIPDAPRDASAAAVTASALVELSKYDNKKYLKSAEKILKSLASSEYTAKIGENNDFILKHSVGSIPHDNEIDVPLNYADYYYIEALLRYQETTE